MADSRDEEIPKFKVVDKRRFEIDGSERGKSVPIEPKVESTKGSVMNEQKKEGFTVQPSSEESHEVADFGSFVMSLATQALMLLGAIEQPKGVSIPLDRDGAKQMIDILAMLKVKTKGNLDEVEAGMLEEILHTLRMNFVSAK